MTGQLKIILLLAWAASLCAVGFWQNDAGHVAERTEWQKRDNKQLIAANDTIQRLQTEARAREQDHAARLSEISTTYQQELQDADVQRRSDVAAVRAGYRLRVPVTTAPGSGIGAVPAAGAAACRCDDRTGAELPDTVTADLLGLAADANAIVRQLTACQSVIRADR